MTQIPTEQAKALKDYKAGLKATSFELDLSSALNMAYQCVGAIENEEVGWDKDADRALATLGAAYAEAQAEIEQWRGTYVVAVDTAYERLDQKLEQALQLLERVEAQSVSNQEAQPEMGDERHMYTENGTAVKLLSYKGEAWEQIKTGDKYVLVCRAAVKAKWAIDDGEEIVVYQGQDGRLLAQEADEFLEQFTQLKGFFTPEDRAQAKAGEG